MILADLQYFPPVSLFSASYRETDVVFDEYEAYRKMSFRNRCLIAGANNIIGLTIPLDGGRQQRASMKEIKLSATEPWQKQHWRSLHSAYNRSPYFDHYAGELEQLYGQKQVWLLDWNRACLEWIKQKTGWPPAIRFLPANSWLEKENPASGMQAAKDWRNRLLPKNYLHFPAPVYHQVFEDRLGFQANLSVLDLLFNTGPQACGYLAGELRGGTPAKPTHI